MLGDPIGPPVWLLHQTTSQPCFHVNKGNMDNKPLKFRRGETPASTRAAFSQPAGHPWFWAITAHAPNGIAATPRGGDGGILGARWSATTAMG